MRREFFLHSEAAELIGQPIRLKAEWCGLPQHTAGRVVNCQPAMVRDQFRLNQFGVLVEWDAKSPTQGLDWITKREYFRHCEELCLVCQEPVTMHNRSEHNERVCEPCARGVA